MLAFQAVLLLGARVAAVAQQATPVQSFGQSAPDMALPLPVQSTELQKESDQLRASTQAEVDVALPALTPSPDGTSPTPWWEGQAAIAEQSMETSPYKFGLNLLTGWEYDDNVFLSNIVDGKAHSVFVRPTASFSYKGSKLNASASYSGEYRTYNASDIDDTFNQIFSGGADYMGPRFKAGLAVALAQTDNGNIEISGRAKSVSLNVALNTAYEISTKTTVGTFTSWNRMDYEDYISSERYGTRAFADYKLTPKTTFGLSGGYEVTDVSEGADSVAYELLLRSALKMSEKLQVRGNAGYERREYDGGESRDAPVFSVGLLYNPTETTALSVDGYRRNTPSIASPNQSYYATGLAVNFTQTIMGKFQAGISGGYEFGDYESSVSDQTVNREDTYWFVRPHLTYSIREWLAFSVFYQHSQNDSSTGTAFERNLIGTNLGITF